MEQEKLDNTLAGILISISILGLIVLFTLLFCNFTLVELLTYLCIIAAGNFFILVFVILVTMFMIGIILVKDK